MLTTEGLYALLQLHGYILLFVIMLLEGSTVTYVASFLASGGFFNIYMVLALSILGSILGDTAFFFAGRHFGKNYVFRHFHRLRKKSIGKIIAYSRKNPGKSIAIIKNSPVIPIPGIMLLGASGMNAKRFYTHSTYMTILRSLALVLLGYFSGSAFSKIARGMKRIEVYIGAAIILALIIGISMAVFSRRIQKKL